MYPQVVELTEAEWRVLTALKRELAPEEIVPDVWQRRADEAGVDPRRVLPRRRVAAASASSSAASRRSSST